MFSLQSKILNHTAFLSEWANYLKMSVRIIIFSLKNEHILTPFSFLFIFTTQQI